MIDMEKETVNNKTVKIYTYEEAIAKSLEYFNGDELAASVFVSKYALRDNKNNIIEASPEEMHRRLAKEFARIESKYPNPIPEAEIFEYFDQFNWIIPQGSPMSAIGNPYQIQSCSNCFVVPSPEDSYGGIMKTDQEQAQIMKRRGGVGFDISYIRPKGLETKNAARTTDGIGVFMDRFSNTCREVAQNGRRGALMLTISCHHPEILTFVNIKKDRKRVTGANISIRLSDEFMEAVRDGREVELRWPVESKTPKVSKMVDARSIWNQIIDAAWESAEPGLLFWDTAQKYTPSDIYKDFGYASIATNPCLTYDVNVALADGRGFLPIGKLAEEGKDVPVYCCDDKGRIAVRTMRNPRITGYNQDVYKVTLDDGSSFKATGNHKVLLNDGTYVEVLNLKNGDSLHVATRDLRSIKDIWPSTNARSQDYIWWHNSNRRTIKSDHRLIFEHHNNTKIGNKKIIHHIDYNAQNNNTNNLTEMSKQDHDHLHSRNMIGKNNPIFKIKSNAARFAEYSQKMSESCSGLKNGNAIDISNSEIKSYGIQLTLSLGRRFSSQDWSDYSKANGLPQVFTEFRQTELGSLLDFAKKCAEVCGFSTEEIKQDPRLIKTKKFAEAQGYRAFISNGEVWVSKKCAVCGNDYSVRFERREQAVCGKTCSNFYVNKVSDTNKRRACSINKTYQEKTNKNKKLQLDIYTKLKGELRRDPMLKEWENECKTNSVPCRLKTKHGFRNFKELSESAITHNHRVISVEYVGKENVYNGTVDEFHNFYMGAFLGKNKFGKDQWTFLNNLQCGEIILSAYDSCRLLCSNLFSFVINPFTKNARFDFDKMEKISEIAQRLMDDMIDIEIEQIDKILAKIDADPESDDSKYAERNLWENIKKACINGRRTGLGITALGDTLAALGIRYGSKESIAVTEKIYKALAIGSYRSSCVMAKERGAFPIFSANLEKGHPFLQRIWDAAPDVYELYKKYGRRNIANTTTAPTGSVSTLTQTTSGIESAFLVFYTRWKKINPNDHFTRVDRTDEMGDKWQAYPVFHHHFKTWMDVNGYKFDESKTKDVQKAEDLEFYKDSPYYKATSNDVDWVASVDIQSVAQKWIDHAISKTCNLPKDCTKEVVAEVYMRAWEKGCKGFTVYRDGCRDGVLVANNASKKETLHKTNAPKRPKVLDCDIHHTKSRGEDFFVIVGLLDGHPYEVFAGKNGCITHAKKGKISKHQRGQYVLDADDETTVNDVCDLLTDEQAVITRLCSLSLRHGSDISYVVDQLEKSPGDMTNFGKAIGRVLKKYIKDGTKVTGYACESCGGTNVIRQEGCATCKDCGSSKCS